MNSQGPDSQTPTGITLTWGVAALWNSRQQHVKSRSSTSDLPANFQILASDWLIGSGGLKATPVHGRQVGSVKAEISRINYVIVIESILKSSDTKSCLFFFIDLSRSTRFNSQRMVAFNTSSRFIDLKYPVYFGGCLSIFVEEPRHRPRVGS